MRIKETKKDVIPAKAGIQDWTPASAGVTAYILFLAMTIGLATRAEAAPPVNPLPTSISASSITMSWGLPGGTLGFLVEASTSSTFTTINAASATYNNTVSTLTVSGLLENATYYLRAGSLTSGATDYALYFSTGTTLTAWVSGAQVLQSSTTSITAGWISLGAGNAVGYVLQVSTNSGFSGIAGSTSTPNVFQSTLTVSGLLPGTTYFLRVGGTNWKGVQNFILFGSTRTISSGGGSGLGTAVVAPANVPAGGVLTTTLTYTVPPSGMSTGGRLEITLPFGGGSSLQNTNPSGNGYMLVVTTAVGVNFNIATSSQPLITLTAGTIPAGTQIQIGFWNLYTSCPGTQNTAVWGVKSAMGSVNSLASLSSTPSQNFIPGPARWLWYNPWTTITVAANTPSAGLVLQASDNCGQPAVLAGSVTVTLNGYLSSGTTDLNAEFSTVSNFASTTSVIGLPAASTATVFYYRTPAIGNYLSIRGTYYSPFDGSFQEVWRSVNVLSQAFSFGSPSVDSGTAGSSQTSMTLSPDSDGVNDFAYVRFVPSDPAVQWHVMISSNSFQTIVFDRWGSGNPYGSLSWDGRDFHTNAIVPNGTYAVRIEAPGLLIDNSLSITLNTAQISGTVTLGGSPVAGAQVNASGVNTAGYSSVQTDSSGNYTLFGLRSGSVYNLYMSYYSTTTQAQITQQLNNVTAPASGRNFVIANPGVVRVAVIVSTPSVTSVYGSINLYSNNQNYWGSVRLLPGTTTSDNGDYFNPSTWTLLGVPPGTYTLQLNMQGYGAPSQPPVTVTAGSSQDIVINLTTRATIYGKITLSTPTAASTWISVQGTPLNSNFPTVFGGTSFNVGQTTGIYSVFAVSAGTYTFTAQTAGYVPNVATGVVVGVADIGDPTNGGLNFSNFSTGGKISGSLTVNGNTSAQINPWTLWISAFSPQQGQNAFTQVSMTPDATQSTAAYVLGGLADGIYQINPPYLPGFSASPPGPQSVTVTGGVGTLNLVMNENTGVISGNIQLPGVQNDYTNVHLSLQGPISREKDLTSGPAYTLGQLDTGYYRLIATYLTTGARREVNVGVTNGQTQNVFLNLSGSTYSVSGVVSVQSGFSMTNTSGSVVTVNTIPELLDAATEQVLILGGISGFSTTGPGFQCIGGTATMVTTARVEAFPKNFNSYAQANRNGLNNCFGVGEYKYGEIAADGTFTIEGLTPGLWEVSVYPYFSNGTSPSVSVQKQVISIVSTNVSSTNFALSNGGGVSGTLNLPTGLTDTRTFNVRVVSDRGDTVQSSSFDLGHPGNPEGSAEFSFTHLPAGHYSIVIQDPGTFDPTLQRNVIKYVAQPVAFQISGGDVSGLTVSLSYASRIVGKLALEGTNADGSLARTLVTTANTDLIPANLSINAQANPWVPSGYAQANRGMGGRIEIDSNNQFSIDGLISGTYDVMFQQSSFGFAAQSSVNLAAYTQGGVVVPQGQTLDLGTISLKPGLQLSGLVTDSNNTPLANIRVRAYPSNSQNGRDGQEAFTNSAGRFTFSGLSSVVRVYDLVVAPRPRPGETIEAVPYGQVKRLALDVTQPQTNLTFVLPAALAGFSGRVVTVDSGTLSFPQGERNGYPAAAIFVNLQGTNSADNPLGDENATALDGNFTITNLPAGVYDLTIMSLGYRPIKLTGLTLTNTTTNLGTLTLQLGPSLTATLTRPDGTAVNTGDVHQAIAASADLSSIIFGQINSDAQTNNIVSIKFAGFELSPKAYSVLLFDSRDNIIVPPDGRNILFTANADSLTKALTFQPSAPLAITNVVKSGSDVLITYYFSRPLRNGPNDQDPTLWLTRTSGAGTLSGVTLSGDRRQLKAVYTPAAGELNATLDFSAHTVDVDAATGTEFVIAKRLALLLGQKATAEETINSALGGDVSLSDALDPSNISIPANSLLNTDGTAADATTSYAFTFSATDDASSVGAGMLAGAPRVAGMMAKGPAAYISEAYAAMQSARVTANVNPLSSFYSVLLPAGLSHSLNQTASLTLNYDTNADPNLINVYYFNGSQYLIENNQRVVDTANHTITVGVSHFSTFVVLQNNASVVIVDGDVSSVSDIEVFNFPNPFDLQTKTKTLNHGGTSTTLTTEGTIIRYSIPAAKSGPAKIEIYNIIGEKVRTIDLGVPTADTFHYVDWDGRNDSGRQIASGVYIGMLKSGSTKKFFKMAVIK